MIIVGTKVRPLVTTKHSQARICDLTNDVFTIPEASKLGQKIAKTQKSQEFSDALLRNGDGGLCEVRTALRILNRGFGHAF